ncbi:MAG: hypothetical protein ACR652_25845 [Methylocystis sp.]|uniref:hypothetical protein n=1 Tax=Methylocystis sp. TaxID=1911079 RepID=UPI003DA5D421
MALDDRGIRGCASSPPSVCLGRLQRRGLSKEERGGAAKKKENSHKGQNLGNGHGNIAIFQSHRPRTPEIAQNQFFSAASTVSRHTSAFVRPPIHSRQPIGRKLRASACCRLEFHPACRDIGAGVHAPGIQQDAERHPSLVNLSNIIPRKPSEDFRKTKMGRLLPNRQPIFVESDGLLTHNEPQISTFLQAATAFGRINSGFSSAS